MGARHYSPEQVSAWGSRYRSSTGLAKRSETGADIWVACPDDNPPVAYTLLEPDGHLDMLYCHPDHTRRGVADALLSQAEEFARDIGLKRLHTEASELARSAFERAGYAVDTRQNFTIAYGEQEVAIHNYEMSRPLD